MLVVEAADEEDAAKRPDIDMSVDPAEVAQLRVALGDEKVLQLIEESY